MGFGFEKEGSCTGGEVVGKGSGESERFAEYVSRLSGCVKSREGGDKRMVVSLVVCRRLADGMIRVICCRVWACSTERERCRGRTSAGGSSSRRVYHCERQ